MAGWMTEDESIDRAVTIAEGRAPAAVVRHFDRYQTFRGEGAVATGLWIHGQWERIPMHLQRPISRDWAAGAMAAGATAVIINYQGVEADFQLDELA